MDNSLYNKADKLKALVYKKEQFKNVLNDISSRYFEKGTIQFNLKSKEINSKYNEGTSIIFDDDLLKIYLQSEISNIQKEILELISSLQMEGI